MRVILDSSIICADPRLEGAQFRILLTSAKRTGTTVIIPEVVLDEVVAHQRRRLAEIGEEWRKLSAKASQLVGRENVAEALLREGADEDYAKYLRQSFKKYHCRLAPYPTPPHPQVVARILTERRPFHRGEKGYRDFLVWESVLSLAQNDVAPIAFITANSRDFGEGELHEHFVDDLRGKRAQAEVTLFDSLSALNRQLILPALETLTELERRFNDDAEDRFSVRDWARKSLFEFLREYDFDDGFSPFDSNHAQANLSKLLKMGETEVTRVLRLPEGDLLVRASTGLKVEVSLSADGDDMRHEDVREWFATEDDPFGSFLWASCDVPTDANVDYSLVLRRDDLQLVSVDVDRISAFAETTYNQIDDGEEAR
jgi:hypothetical protein